MKSNTDLRLPSQRSASALVGPTPSDSNACRLFLVSGMQRSGTTVIACSLDSHPAIHCHGELLLRAAPEIDRYNEYVSERVKRSDRLMHPFRTKVRFVEDTLRAPDMPRVSGFKLMYDQMVSGGRLASFAGYHWPSTMSLTKNRSLLRWLRQNDVYVVHVIRTNLLKVLVSRDIASARGIYHSSEGSTSITSIRLRTSDLISRLRNLEQALRQAHRFFVDLPTLKVFYETYLDAPGEVTKDVCEFLGVESNVSLEPGLTKMTNDALDKVITNIDEVRHSLKGTPFESFLYSKNSEATGW